jgi:hypothetical protein
MGNEPLGPVPTNLVPVTFMRRDGSTFVLDWNPEMLHLVPDAWECIALGRQLDDDD